MCARRRPGGARSATRSRPRPRSLQSLRSPLAPPNGYTRSGFAPCAPGTAPQHRLAPLRYAVDATAGPAVRYHNTGAPGQCRGRRAAAGPQARLPPGATPAPPRATAFVVGAGRRRTSGAVRLARVAPPVLSACRSIPRCAALAIPDHHPLRPNHPGYTRGHTRIGRCAHNPPNPTHPGYTGAPHRCSTSASLQPACAKPRTPVRTGKRAVRLPADSAPGFGTPVLTRGPTRTVRFAASSPRIKRPLRSRTLRSRTLSKSGLWPHPPTPAGRVRLGAAFVNGPLRSPLTGDAPPLQTPARSARGRASLCFLHFLHFLQTAGPPSGYKLRGRSPRGRGSRAPTSPTTPLKQIVAPRRHATLGCASLGSAPLRITRAGPALRLAAPVLQTSAHAPPVAGLRYTSSVSFVSSVGAGPASAYKHRARSARGRAAL